MKAPIQPAKNLAGVLALVFAWLLPAGAMDVTFDVQPRLLNLGETAQATLVFHGGRNAPAIEFPQIPGLQITGTGQDSSFPSRAESKLNSACDPVLPMISMFQRRGWEGCSGTAAQPANQIPNRAA